MVLLPILLPEGFTPVVSVGDTVTMGQTLATSPIERHEQAVNLLRTFGISRRQVRHVLRKNPGDGVKPGDLIAAKKGLFGREIRLVSRAHGTVKQYDADTGTLILIRSEAGDPENPSEELRSVTMTLAPNGKQTAEIHAPLDGKIYEIHDDKILLETSQSVLTAQHGAGGNVQAEIFVLPSAIGKDGMQADVSPHEIDYHAKGKIILGGVFDREDLVKCSSLGVLGIVGATIEKEEIHYLLEKHLLIPLVQVDEIVWQRIAKTQGKQLFLDADNGTILILLENETLNPKL